MSNEIERHTDGAIAWNGKPVRGTDEQIIEIIGPMFTMFPSAKSTAEMVNLYVMMLRDLDPQVLAAAVLKAMNSCKFLPTVADIREQVPEKRAPGPASPVDLSTRKDVPTTFFRLPDDEDKHQRLERLRQTKNWDKFYS